MDELRGAGFNVSTVLVDGLVIISNVICVVPAGTFQVQPNLKVQRSSTKKFKSCQTFKNFTQVFEIKLGKINGFDVSVIISTKNYRVDFSTLIRIVNDASGSALGQISETKSGKLWNVSAFKAGNISANRSIYGEDLKRWSSHMFREMCKFLKNEFRREYGEVIGTPHFVIYAFGQSLNFDTWQASIRSQIHFEQAQEVIIHFAKDISQQNSSCYFSVEALEAVIAKPSASFYPLGIPFCGNHYAYVNTLDASVPQLGCVKVYNECFSKVHLGRAKDPPFKSAKYGSRLWDLRYINTQSEKSNQALNFLQFDCTMIKNNLEDLANRRFLSLRVELIITVMVTPQESILAACYQLAQIWYRKPAFGSVECYKLVPMVEILEKIRHVVEPTLRSLEHQIMKLKRIDTDHPFRLRIKELYTVCACEAILSFMVYGSSKSISGKRAHCNELCDELLLDCREVERGTDVCNFLKQLVHGDRLLYCPKDEKVPRRLFLDLESVCYGDAALDQLLDLMDPNSDDELVFRESITYIVLLIIKQGTKIELKPCHPSLTHKSRTDNCWTMSSFRFIYRIFNKTLPIGSTLRLFFELVKRKLQSSVRVNQFLDILSIALDSYLWNEGTYLIYTVSSRSCFLIVPFFCIQSREISIAFKKLARILYVSQRYYRLERNKRRIVLANLVAEVEYCHSLDRNTLKTVCIEQLLKRILKSLRTRVPDVRNYFKDLMNFSR